MEALKILPNDEALESAVIGCMLLEKSSIDIVMKSMDKEDFYHAKQKTVFEVIKNLYDSNSDIDIMTVVAEAKSKGVLENCGGIFFINSLTTNINSIAHLDTHCHILKKYSKSRAIIMSFRRNVADAYEGRDPDEIIEEASKTIFNVQKGEVDQSISSVGDLSEEVINRAMAVAEKGDGITGLETGINAVDEPLSGLNGGTLNIVAARPGMGKTAFIISIAKNLAVDYSTPVALFSLEMSNIDFTRRLHANHCLVDNQKLKTGQLSESEWADYHYNLSDLLEASIYIDDTPSLSINDLKVKARQLVNEKKVGAIFVDYLQLMSMPSGREFSNRDLQIGHVTRTLKTLSKELNIPIILLSQLSRAVEARPDKRPMLSDLRESGNIEQDADTIMFLYRPSYYDENPVDQNGITVPKTYTELIIAKNRDGYVGTMPMHFVGQHFLFQDQEPEVENKFSYPVEEEKDELKDMTEGW